MSTVTEPQLPIDSVLGAIAANLARDVALVVVAPPGAGKTTRVPLRLMDEPWLEGQRIILLEPRRLAARAAAERMAASLSEPVGARIGLRMRLQTLVSAKTRIEVVTEGVFARMIVDDPMLEGIGLVIFDEFHERSLDADLALALALDAQNGLRADLRLLVMSATLDGARVSRLLGDCALIESQGRSFPVETHYLGRNMQVRIEDEMARAITRALRAGPGSLLAFLPGQAEIIRTGALLADRLKGEAVEIAPLYGALERQAQDAALRPAAPGMRKIVLATSIAETSLTLPDIRLVVDSGLARVPLFEPGLGLTHFATQRVSQASADQRRGRAGRLAPGLCFRLWESAAHAGLAAFATPEILSADLSGLVLDLAQWGVTEASTLPWLDPPPGPALAEARKLLLALGALDRDGRITAEGKTMRALPVSPRLARMVVGARATGEARLAAELAAVLMERGLGGHDVDLGHRITMLARDQSPRGRAARQWTQRLGTQRPGTQRPGTQRLTGSSEATLHDPARIGAVLALAFPDRIAKARGKPGEFIMRNGRAAALEPHLALARAPFAVLAEIVGRAGAGRVLAAAEISLDAILAQNGEAIEERDELSFDSATASLKARRRSRLDALVLHEQILTVPPGPEAARLLATGIAGLGLDRLPLSATRRQWLERLEFLRQRLAATTREAWPDMSRATLEASMPTWFAPFIEGRTSLSAITEADCEAALDALVGHDLGRRLASAAPTHFQTPAGSHHPLDYAAEGAPVLAVRVQELFGLALHPTIAGGKIGLTLHLLSPAHRPIQITRDLPGFWRGSWAEVRRDLRGRYPRHFWPEDPSQAQATNRAKPRGT